MTPEWVLDGVVCPFCNSKQIDIGKTSSTLLYFEESKLWFTPNKVTTDYGCKDCKKRFEIERKIKSFKLKEEYVFKENDEVKRKSKEGLNWKFDK